MSLTPGQSASRKPLAGPTKSPLGYPKIEAILTQAGPVRRRAWRWLFQPSGLGQGAQTKRLGHHRRVEWPGHSKPKPLVQDSCYDR